MLVRLMLLLIPALTFLVPMRWFGFYVILVIMLAAVQIAMILLLRDEYAQALTSFGMEAVIAYIAVNLLLLAVRHRLIARARARITKLPAPHTRP
jgi:hypothetical protein